MRGQRKQQEPLFVSIRLEEMVPENHLLRRMLRRIDFGFIDEKTRDLYSSTGRPSIDPQVLIRMMLIGYLFGLSSERRLCQEVHLNMAYRWFCGLSLEDKVPDHSSFSKNRTGRFAGTTLFRDLFYAVVEQAMGKGLVSGKHVSVDATTVAANASLESLEPIVVTMTAQSYWQKMEEQNSPAEEVKAGSQEGSAPKSPPPEKPKLSNQTHRSSSDPEAKLFSKPFQQTKLAYSNNVLMDNRKRVILDVEITEPNLHQEGQAAAIMVQRSRFRLGLEPQTLGADKAYAYGAAAAALVETGVAVHAPLPKQSGQHAQSKGIFGPERFIYHAQADEMICPAGKSMKARTWHEHNQMMEYAASKVECRSCPLKEQCTRAASRVVHRHIHQPALDLLAQWRLTHNYRISLSCRKRIEHLFAEAKEQMGLRRARLRGKTNLLEQCLMTALAQNLKRIVNALEDQPQLAQPQAPSLFKLIRSLIKNWEFFFHQIFFQKYSAHTPMGTFF
jgi:transposase